ncbi:MULTISPECIES: hypothetical protein [Nocardiopsis]|uniref:hypothetical protein n=1 Tax=Nocardiopsis TaxID=2013 RepID=UPI00034C4788|nr:MULTISPECIES: hypothetical protein [Nocardiopsis]PWV52992.1 hypothetical protein BDW27_105338 [Nocardiopsis sp. L17-MgMaSL7]
MQQIAFVILILAGLLLLGLATGFLLAVSIGIRRADRNRTYRSLRRNGNDSALSRSSRAVVGLRFRDDRGELPDRGRTPTAV